MVFWFSAAGASPAAASQIREIRLRLEAEEFEENGRPVLGVYCGSEKYTVTGVKDCYEEEEGKGSGPGRTEERTEEKTEEGNEAQENSGKKPFEYEIELTAEEEEGFSVMEQEDIHFSGQRAVCHRTVRKDGGQTLLLTVELLEPGEMVGEIAHVWLEPGCVRWEAAPNADTYLVMLYRNSRRVGHSHRTSGLSYDVTPLMEEPGIYSCRVYPLTEKGKKGEPAESGWIRVERETAEGMQEGWRERIRPCEETEGMEKKEGNSLNEGWRRTKEGWIYIQRDGTLPQENWLFIGESWYYFDHRGVRREGVWQQWKGKQYYLGDDGRLTEESSPAE